MSNKLLKACSVLPVFAVCGMISTGSFAAATNPENVKSWSGIKETPEANQSVYGGILNISGSDYKDVVIDAGNVDGNKIIVSKNGTGSEVVGQGSVLYSKGSLGTINGTFSNNSVVNTSETASKATANGAVFALYAGSNINEINGDFTNNSISSTYVGTDSSTSKYIDDKNQVSAGGGAIHIEGQYNNGNGGPANIGTINGNFIGNSATGDAYANGGAIYLKGGADRKGQTGYDATIDQINGNFINNRVVAKASSSMFADVAYEKNSTGGAISIKNATPSVTNAEVNVKGMFGGNGVTTNATDAFGGAVYNEGTFSAEGNFINNFASSVGGTANGGALYNSGTATINGHFTNNNVAAESDTHESGSAGGAIFNSGNLNLADGLTFYGNRAGYAGGAIYNNGTIDSLQGMNFFNNISQQGGAINNTDASGQINNISDSVFNGNIASQGGAIKNQGTIASITGSTFQNNMGTNGGALWNEGTISEISNTQFIGNSATVRKNDVSIQGGAIYNDESGVINFKGTNLFSGNMTGDVSNDIYNLGTLTISDGSTSIGGGITGTGTLNLDSGATLDIGTATVEQSNINLNGNLAVSIINSQSYGKIVGENVEINGDKSLTLNIGAVGVYDIFANGALADVDGLNINANDALYDVSVNQNNEIVVNTKAVEEIVAATNLSVGSASVLAGLANSDSYDMGIAALNAQQALAEGNTEYVEAESAKLKADDKPVAHSVATSVQNQVLSLASGRMSGGATGRSGGDAVTADYGVWAQGLFNKSKLNGQFHGYTRGVAVGADTLINRAYTIGVGYAYNTTDVHADNARDTDIESNSIFAYAQYKPAAWYVNAALNYTMADYTERTSAFGIGIDSEYDVTSFGGQFMGGYDFPIGFTPEAGVRYLHISQDDYNNGLADIKVGDTDYVTGVAGIKYGFGIDTESTLKFRPELRAAATYDFLSDEAIATVMMPGDISYMVNGNRLSRLGGEFGIGLTAEYKGLEISVNYDLDLHEDYTSQTGMLKFRYKF